MWIWDWKTHLAGRRVTPLPYSAFVIIAFIVIVFIVIPSEARDLQFGRFHTKKLQIPRCALAITHKEALPPTLVILKPRARNELGRCNATRGRGAEESMHFGPV